MNKEQHIAFEAVKDGNNIFITGSGGVGKSYTLKNIIKWAQIERKNIAVTASTGCASYLIRGRTIHSFLGIGLAKKSAEDLANYVLLNKKFIVKKIKMLDMLILDEVSMINDELFDKISNYLQIIRKSPEPFGGIQMVICGDFAQLPPTEGKYCFLSPEWERSNIDVITLTQMMRQSEDHTFQRILQELRYGKCTKDTLKILRTLKKTKFDNNGIEPTVLYSLNVDVDTINNTKYKELINNGAKKQTYITTYSQSGENWAKSIKIPDKQELCVGSQVVLTWNFQQDIGLVNGSRGVIIELNVNGAIVRFVNGQEIIIPMMTIENEDDDKCWVSFIPLKLAYAITIHKSQGMTLDSLIIDLGDSIFEYGQAYTAISRAKTLDSIKLLDVKSSSFKTHKDVISFYENTN
jgi:ATP-dependent exoDNAse (exonuclease V) alpha subunit